MSENKNRILSDGFECHNGNIYDFIPPSPTEETRGGITAKERTTETVEIAVDPITWKAYAPTAVVDATLTKEGESADAKVTGDKIAELKSDLNSKLEGLKSILTDMVTFLKSVPFDDTTASSSDLDTIQDKINKLSESSGEDEEPDKPNPPVEEPDKPTESEWVDVESTMYKYNTITPYIDEGNTVDESMQSTSSVNCRVSTEPFSKDGVVELAITEVTNATIMHLASGLLKNPPSGNSQTFDVWYSKKINPEDLGSTRNDRFTVETNGSVQIHVKAGYHLVLFIKNTLDVFPSTFTWSLKYKEGV